MKFFYSILIILLIFSFTTKAQEFGGNPPSIKWNQINTPEAKVIFPIGLDSTAKRVANIVKQLNLPTQPTIGPKRKQISILLQNQTTISNAYVGLAPFRSEFYLTPLQNSLELGSLPWADQLAIHEFRHVQQFNNFNVGFSHFLKILLGETGQGIANGLAIPNWFFEGDAVFNETYVSEQGRGRLPYFFNGYRSLWVAKKDYSWMKLRNGSLIDYVPDWYPTGYMLVSYGREKYGDNFWRNVTQDAAAYKGVFYPFQKAIKKYSGKTFDQFNIDALSFFKEKFNADVVNKTDNEIIVEPKHFLANQEYPAFVGDTGIIYVKTSYNTSPTFVYKSAYGEQTITSKGISLDNYFAYNNCFIIYTGYKPDLRWNYRNYSEIRLLNIKTGKEKRLTKKTKYFAPDFNADGSKIITVEQPPNGRSSLCILRGNNGQLLSIIPNPLKLNYTYPKFYDDSKIISAVINTKGKMSIALTDIKSGDSKFLLPFTFQPIAFTVIKNDTVYFSATSGINDNLYAFDIKNHNLLLFKNSIKYNIIGKYQIAVSDKKLAFVGFTAAGNQIIELNKKDVKWEVVNNETLVNGLTDFGISALAKDSAANLLSKIMNDSLVITKYYKSHHLINFHSIIPDLNSPNYTVSLEGQNVLNTLQTSLLFNYNTNEGYKEFGFRSIYGALFPYLYGGVDYIIDRNAPFQSENLYWNETKIYGGLEIPLNLTSGKKYTFLNFGSDINYSNNAYQGSYKILPSITSYAYLNNYINFSNTIQQAKQNIYPSLGQNIIINYKSAVSGIYANQLLTSGNFYLPGLAANNNFVINLAFQQHVKFQNISFSNDFPFSRGYQVENFYQMKKAGINYHFPIAYPDEGFGNLAYVLRLRGNFYYDYTQINDFYFNNGQPFNNTFRTTGAELYFDTKLFNEVAITFGFRYSYLLDQDIFGGRGHNRFELIVPLLTL